MCCSLLGLVSHHDRVDLFESSIPIAWHQDDTCLCLVVFECKTAFVCLNASLSAINTYTDDDRGLIVDVTDELRSAFLDPRNVSKF